jgi:signal transduction histidine kinase
MDVDNLFEDDLLMVVAHELKSPISAVRGYIELMQQAGALNEAQSLYSARALDGLERMEQLVLALLELGRLERGDTLTFEDCDLGAIATSAVELVENMARKRGVHIHTQIDPALSLVLGDRYLLGHAISNLLVNAIKYNRENGTVWLTVTNQPDFVRVDVRDTGVGIPQADHGRVFDRFFRAANSAKTRASGSGLGLTIVRTVIQKHQGYIWLKSVEGEGSTFSFTIPRKDQRAEGGDAVSSMVTTGEGYDVRHRGYHESSLEDIDDVDDNSQEARGSKEIDSSSDEV